MTKDELMKALDDEMRGRASDLDQIMPVIVEFVAGWLEDFGKPDCWSGVELAERWREDMA